MVGMRWKMEEEFETVHNYIGEDRIIRKGAISCKKDETPDPNNADFFIDVDFLPESETNGEVAPRLMANFNDEMVMIEIRPSADS